MLHGAVVGVEHNSRERHSMVLGEEPNDRNGSIMTEAGGKRTLARVEVSDDGEASHANACPAVETDSVSAVLFSAVSGFPETLAIEVSTRNYKSL